jgi:hypothetical protein
MEAILNNGTSQRLINLLDNQSNVKLDPNMTDARRRAFVIFILFYYSVYIRGTLLNVANYSVTALRTIANLRHKAFSEILIQQNIFPPLMKPLAPIEFQKLYSNILPSSLQYIRSLMFVNTVWTVSGIGMTLRC